MLFRAFSRGGFARREHFRHEGAVRPAAYPTAAYPAAAYPAAYPKGSRAPDAPVRRVAAVALTDVRLGSLGLALARQGSFAEWMGRDEL